MDSISEITTKLNQCGSKKYNSYYEIATRLPTFSVVKYEDIKTKWEKDNSVPIFYVIRKETHNNYYLLNPVNRDDFLKIVPLFKPSRPQQNIVFYKPDKRLLNWLNLQYVQLENILKRNKPRTINYLNKVNYLKSGIKRPAPPEFIKNALPKRHSDGR